MATPAPTTANGRRGLWRWTVALGATIALVVSGSGLVVFAQAGAGESKGPQFVPADAPIYIEARMDMPDGQAEALAEFMTAFPGFADSGGFGMKSDQLIDGLVEEISGGALTFSGEMESFLTGEMGLALTDIESAAMNGDDPTVLAGIAVSDPDGAQSFMDLLTAGSAADGDLTEEMYGDTAIVSDPTTAMAVTDEWILLSQSVDEVKASIDALDGTTDSLADDPDFTAAFSRLPSGRLAAAYMNLQSFGSFIDLAGMVASGQTGLDVPTDDLAALLPQNMVAYLAAEADRMTLEAFITPADGTLAVPLGESELASLFPADTQLYLETRELGTTLETVLTGLLDTMDEATMEQLAPFESMLGKPLPSFLDFVTDAGVGAGLSSDGLWLGIAAEVNDEATAAARVERIMSIVRLLGGASPESGVAIKTVPIEDHSVTVITLPIDETMAGSGLGISVGDTISVAVANDSLLVGTGDFVESALTQPGVDSLGASAGYTDALAGDTVNAGVLYANISSLLAALDPLISLMVPEWADIQPYATGLDRMIAVGAADDDGVISSRMTVIVKQ